MNLCINGIATAIHTNAANRVHDVAPGLPRVRRALGNAGYESWAPSDFFNDVDLPLCAIQGYLSQVYRVDKGWDHVRPSPGGQPYDRGGSAGRSSHGYGCLPSCDWNSRNNDRDGGRPSPCDLAIRLDQNHCVFLRNVQCDACKQIGHIATNCDILAMALFLDKYIRQSPSDKDKHKVESAWLRKHKDKLGLPQRPPSQVMKAL
jgi:hypothetical protein